jgi:hypothetical protein
MNSFEDCAKAEQMLPSAQCELTNTVTDRLTSEKRRLESKLADVNAALDALAANPEVAKVLTLVGKAVGRI